MKKYLLLLSLVCCQKAVLAQQNPAIYTIRADSVKITNDCDTAELIIENHTQNVQGFLYNKGRGRTEFRRAQKMNDSTLILGGDTIVVRGGDNSLWQYDINSNLTHKPFSGDSVKLNNKLFYVNGNMTQSGNLLTMGQHKINVANHNILFCRNQPTGSTGQGNIGIGMDQTFQSLTTGAQNVGIGHYAMTGLTTGGANIALGAGALQRTSSGAFNVGLGYQSLQWVTTTSNNIDIGGYSSNASVGNNNVFIGVGGSLGDVIQRSLGNNNIVIGKRPSGAQSRVSTNDSNIVIGNLSYTSSTTNTTIIGSNLNTSLSNVVLLGKANQRILIGTNTNNGAKLQVGGTGFFSDTLTATTMGNADNSNRVATTAFVKNVIGAPALNIVSAGISDVIVSPGVLTKLPDLNSAGSHSVTLPSASSNAGQRIYLWNMNNSSNSWTFANAVTLPDGTTTTTIVNQTTIELISDGTIWLQWK